MSTAQDWAKAFLANIGAPADSQNVANVIAWGTAESGAPGSSTQEHGGWSNFNPLNIVATAGDGHIGMGGTQGNIADFGDANTGARASANLFLGNARAGPIIDALRNGSDLETLNGAINGFYSTWGGSINLPGVAPGAGNASIGGGAGGSSSSSSGEDHPKGSRGCDDGPDLLVMPGSIPNLTRCNGRALLGGAAIVAGVAIVAVGLALLVAGTKGGRQVIALAGTAAKAGA